MYLLPEHEALVGDEHVQPPVHGGDGRHTAPTGNKCEALQFEAMYGRRG